MCAAGRVPPSECCGGHDTICAQFSGGGGSGGAFDVCDDENDFDPSAEASTNCFQDDVDDCTGQGHYESGQRRCYLHTTSSTTEDDCLRPVADGGLGGDTFHAHTCADWRSWQTQYATAQEMCSKDNVPSACCGGQNTVCAQFDLAMCEDMSQSDPAAMGKRLCGQFPVASEADCHADATFVHVGGDMGCVFPNMYVASDQECKALVNNGDNYHYEDKSCGDFRSEASSINANENGWCMGQSKEPINYPPYEGCCGSSPTVCASLPACVDDEGRLQAESGQQMQSCAEGVAASHNYCFDASYLVDQQGAGPGWFKSVCCDTCASHGGGRGQ